MDQNLSYLGLVVLINTLCSVSTFTSVNLRGWGTRVGMGTYVEGTGVMEMGWGWVQWSRGWGSVSVPVQCIVNFQAQTSIHIFSLPPIPSVFILYRVHARCMSRVSVCEWVSECADRDTSHHLLNDAASRRTNDVVASTSDEQNCSAQTASNVDELREKWGQGQRCRTSYKKSCMNACALT